MLYQLSKYILKFTRCSVEVLDYELSIPLLGIMFMQREGICMCTHRSMKN